MTEAEQLRAESLKVLTEMVLEVKEQGYVDDLLSGGSVLLGVPQTEVMDFYTAGCTSEDGAERLQWVQGYLCGLADGIAAERIRQRR